MNVVIHFVSNKNLLYKYFFISRQYCSSMIKMSLSHKKELLYKFMKEISF
jgi:hypothetical protein